MGYLRYFLAILVVISHMQLDIDHHLFRFGGAAVNVFFFISGFIIPLSFEKQYAGLQSLNLRYTFGFYLNRFLRIFPIYWFAVFIGYIDYRYLNIINIPNEAITSGYNLFRNLILIGISTNVTAIVTPAWALDFELQWYLLVPFLFFLRRKNCDVILFILFTLNLISLSPLLGFIHPYDDFFKFSNYFLGGYLFYRFSFTYKQYNESRMMKIVLSLGLVIFVLSCFVESMLSMSFLSLILISIPLLIRQSTCKPSKLEIITGDLSYPVYILHMGTIPAMFSYSRKFWVDVAGLNTSGIWYHSYLLVCTILGITIISYFALVCIGYPVDRIRRKFKNRDVSHQN